MATSKLESSKSNSDKHFITCNMYVAAEKLEVACFGCKPRQAYPPLRLHLTIVISALSSTHVTPIYIIQSINSKIA